MYIKEGILLILLATAVTAFPLDLPFSGLIQQCSVQAKHSFSQFQEAMNKEDTNAIIDGLTAMMLDLPSTISACFGQEASNEFSKELPPICITDMGKAAKIVVRMENQMDNDFKLSIDTALFEKLYQTKLKKQCPILNGTTKDDIKSGGICLEAAYQFSLVVQQLASDVKTGNKQAAYTDIDKMATTLPNVLDACGQSQWADEIRKFLAMDCVHAVQNLAAELVEVEEHYMHLEWLAKHYKQILASFRQVKFNCPIV